MTRKLGKYQLLKPIASGGMAEIHVAKQLGIEGFEKLVVVKLLQAETARNPAAVELFLNEAKLAAQLSHSNVAQIFDLGSADGEYFIAMEYIHGENLVSFAKAFKKQKRLLSLELLLTVICGALEGLHHAHTLTDSHGRPLNIVHCDISPHNILVSFQGVAKLVDFGIAKVLSRYGKTESNLVAGKLSYMSPEQAQGLPLDARTDIFSLGIVLWELIAGRRLYGRRPAAEILDLLKNHDVPSPRHINPLVPGELEPIILRAVARDPAGRFQDARQMHFALVDFMKRKGMTQSSMELGAVMRDLFRDRIDNVQRIEQAQAAGKGLEDLLFDDLRFDDAMTDPGSPADPEASAPIEIASRPRFAGLPQTGITNVRPRRRWPFKTIGLLVLLAAAAAVGWFYHPQLVAWYQDLLGSAKSSSTNRGTGTLRIESVPDGARVVVDGRQTCTTPCVLASLEVGVEHHFEASLSGHTSESARLALTKAGQVEVLTLNLERLERPGKTGFGSVSVVTDPPGARIELDGRPVEGVTPLTLRRVATGRKHKLRASLDGRQDWRTVFQVASHQELSLEGSLSPVFGRGRALLSIDSTPPAVVFIDDVAKGTTPIDGLLIPAGSHLVELRNPQTRWTESLIVEATEGAQIKERITFPTGVLEAASTPEADVIIHGKRIGTTPIKTELVAGNYEVTFVNFKQNLRKIEKIKIEPKTTTRVSVDLAR